MRAFLYDLSTAIVGAIVGMIAAAICLTAIFIAGGLGKDKK